MEEGQVVPSLKKKERKYQWTIAILVLALVAFGSYNLGLSRESTGGAIVDVVPTNPGNPTPTPTPKADIKVAGTDVVLGDSDAPVTIVEYSDFECPFCGRLYNDAVMKIKAQYVESGDVNLVYRHFPLSFHAQAQKSAEAAECAGEQGKFWEMHDMLFEKGVSGGVTDFKQYAADLGLNTADFDECLDSDKTADKVKSDFAQGQKDGVRGTPAAFVNGILVSGACPFEAFDKAIKAEKEGKEWFVDKCVFIEL